MKAIQYFTYGPADVLELNDIEKPSVDDDKVLVRVRAASVGPHDWHTMTGLPYVARLAFGLRKPKANRLGRDLAGTVEAVGKNVTQFKTGDELFGSCSGAFAEYVLGREDDFAPKPLGLTDEQAAAVPISAYTALQALRDSGKMQPGQRVLINGASGGVGTFAVQIAKSFGASVTGVCSARNAEMVRSIGADDVIDYTREDFVHRGQRYDLILDMVGNRSLSDYRRTLTSRGTLVIVGGEHGGRWFGALAHGLRALASSPFQSQTMRMIVARSKKDDLLAIKELIESHKVAPVVDRSFRLSQVPEAIRYAQEGHAHGKVVITV